MSTIIFGDYKESVVDRLNHFAIHINAQNVSLRWSQCDLMAGFIASYFACFFPEDESGKESMVDRKDITYSINYIMNELVENAVKFRSSGDINISSGLFDQEIVFLVKNMIASTQVPVFQKMLREITDGNPGDLLIQRIEDNVKEDNDTGSGLGFLTMMNDYEVKLGWHFEDCARDADSLWIGTMARLKTRKEE